MEKYICIDIGGTSIKTGMVTDHAEITKKKTFDTPNNLGDFNILLKHIISEVKNEICGIAISCPGTFDVKTGTILHGGNVSYLDNLHLKQQLEKNYKLPVGIINDGKAAVLAEQWRGNLRGIENGIAMILGTAVGGGIIIDSKLVEGSHFQAGEFSFMPYSLNLEGDVVNYGNVGDNLSAVHFLNKGAEILNLSTCDGNLVFTEIECNNQDILPHFNKYCRDVALYLLCINAVLDLEKIVIGGGISSRAILIDEINHQLDFLRSKIPGLNIVMNRPLIENCLFNNDANLVGALYNLISDKEYTKNHDDLLFERRETSNAKYD